MENSTDLARQLSDYDSKRRSSVDLLNEAMGKYGVPELRGRVSGLRTTLTNTENALNAVDPSVTGRTQGSLVTEAQRTKQVADETAPIAQRYGQFSRSLGDATSNLSDQERAAQLLAQGQLTDYENGRQALSGRYELAVGRESEQRRREEADRAYQLQAQEAKRQAAAASGYKLGGGQSTTSTKPTDPVQQGGFNEAMSRIQSQSRDDLISDMISTLKGAAQGVPKDPYKIETYKKYAGELFAEAQKRFSGAQKMTSQPGLNILGQSPFNVVTGNLPAGLKFGR